MKEYKNSDELLKYIISKGISFNIGLKIATNKYHLEKACQLWYNIYKGMYYGKDN